MEEHPVEEGDRMIAKYLKAVLAFLAGFVFWLSLMLMVFAKNLSALSRSAAVYAEFFTKLTVGTLLLLAAWLIVTFARRSSKDLKQAALMTAASGVLAYIAMGFLVFIYQDNLLFSPGSFNDSRREVISRTFPNAEEFWVTAADGTRLQGWIVKNATLEKTPLAIFFAGQGSEASRYLELANRLEGFSAAFVNYRGYGQSGGKPSDKAIFADATAVYDYLVSRGDVDPERVVAIGGSLGTGVATYLASQRDLMGIVLFSPYDRIAGGVTQDMLPFLPTALLFRNKFDVRKYAEATDAFVLAIVGDKDRVITPWRSMLQTANFRNSPSVWTVFIDGGDHYSIYEATETWTAVNNFLSFLLEHSYESSAEPPIFMML